MGDGSVRDASADGSAYGDAASFCPNVGYRCDGTRMVPCGEDGGAARDCASGGMLCHASLGCIECSPGEQTCKGGKASWCRPDGTLARFECDPVQGMKCENDACTGKCAPASVVDSYIGCDYFPTVTLNPVWSGFSFTVAVSNAADSKAHVTITRNDATLMEADLGPGELQLFPLPWVDDLKGGDVNACQQPPDRGSTRLVAGGAYRVRSNQPVTVYQFSPLEYQLDPAPADCPVNADCPGAPADAISECLAYSNDASLLLPATALTGNYTVLSWPSWSQGSGFVAVTAVQDGTQVHLVGAAAVASGAGVDAQGNGLVNLDQGDVLQVIAAPQAGAGYGADLTATRIRADKAVQVIGGHSCAQLPTATTGTCDHLEQAMVPEDSLGSEYVATVPAYVNGNEDSPYVLRILAIEENTSITFSPQVASNTKLSPKDGPLTLVLEGKDLRDVHVKADKPLLIGQYLPGQEALPVSSIAGDPSMSLLPPVEQYRREYLFTAPQTFIANYANIVAPAGANVMLDGKPVPQSDFQSVGNSGLSVARVLLDSGSAVHTLEADTEVGLVVYGYGLFTSYMYPGGMDLKRITVPPII